jgi:cell division protein FtsW
MIDLGRTDRSVVGRWWWTVDRWTLLILLLTMAVGIVLIMAASPAVAERIGLDSFHFVRRQLLYLVPALIALFGMSLLPGLWVRRIAVVGFALSLVLLVGTLIGGESIKGARRWIDFGGFVLQPSEFAKPTFAVFAAWMLAQRVNQPGFPGYALATAAAGVLVVLLLLQPDVGMTLVVLCVWVTQMFLAGIPMFVVAAIAAVGAAGAVGAYALFPHVAGRIDRFLDPSSGDTFQIDASLNAFGNGGLFGTGPGEGIVKSILPDAHADFIFAVAGEELGLFASLAVVVLFAILVLRGLVRLLRETDLFVVLASAGILVQIGLQAVINMGVNVRLLPAKGMTLPFISYGGSSLLALAIGMGIVLALTRRRPGIATNTGRVAAARGATTVSNGPAYSQGGAS